MTRILDGATIAAAIKSEVAEQVRQLAARGIGIDEVESAVTRGNVNVPT